MSQIKSADTSAEIIVRKYLFSKGFRYRKNVAALPGKPDIVLAKYKTCIFVNGCFWHKHDNCQFFKWPKTNELFWKDKIEKNVMRDHKNYTTLQNQGWKVIVIWECQLKKGTRQETLLNLERELKERNLILNEGL